MAQRGLRARAAVPAAALFAAVLAIVLVALIVVLRTSLVDEVDTALELRAESLSIQRQDIIDFALDNGIDELAVGGGPGLALDESTFAVWFDGEDEAALTDERAFVDDQALRQRMIDAFGEADGIRTMELPELVDTTGASKMRVLGLFSPDDPDPDDLDSEFGLLLVIGTSLEGVDRTVRTVAVVAGIALPLLALLVGGLVWVMAGRSLRPVEAIRRRVDDISATDLSQRVPEPGTRDEIGRLAFTMNEMLTRLEHAQDLQRRFISDASHELRSPLASMAAQLDVEIAHGTTGTEESTHLLQSLRTDTSRLQRLVDDLLLLARSDADESPESAALTRTRWSLVDLDDIVEAAARELADARIAVGPATGAVVRGDADKLRRVAVNLLANAVRHARSTVRVTVAEHDGRVAIRVEDDGDGIAPEDREQVFARFVRLDEGRARDHGGSGLGLAICQEIAQEHGGSVTLDTSSLGGAAFTVDLPVT